MAKQLLVQFTTRSATFLLTTIPLNLFLGANPRASGVWRSSAGRRNSGKAYLE